MIAKIGQVIVLAIAVNSLSACALLTGANTQDDFLTKPQVGMPGATIAEVDGVSDDKTIAVSVRREDVGMQERISFAKSGLQADLGGALSAMHGNEYRTEELVGELYIAPYLDQSRILHDGRTIHFVLSEAKWITN